MDDLVKRAKDAMVDHNAFVADQGGKILSHGLMPELVARIEALERERDEARRRRDEWKAKAEGYDELAAAVRAKIKDEPITMSRLLLRAALIEANRRAEAAADRIEALTEQCDAARRDAVEAEAYATELEAKLEKAVEAVSYTHLTLPTKRIV